jgi:hypothetical protein
MATTSNPMTKIERHAALKNMVSSPKTIVRRFFNYARIMPENIVTLRYMRQKATITS